MKTNSRSKSSGQVVAVLVIVLVLLGIGYWWLNSNKQQMTKEGRAFGKEAIQKIGVEHDVNFFNAHLSPQARVNFPPSTQQEFMNVIASHGAPVGAVDVQGDIEFQSQFFEPRGSFHARINYPASYADVNITISHPVGRWQIDDITYAPQQPASAAPPAPAPAAPSAPPASPAPSPGG